MKGLVCLLIPAFILSLFLPLNINAQPAEPPCCIQDDPANCNVDCVETGFVQCTLSCDTNPPTCQPGYRVPDVCISDPGQCCKQPPYGSCDIALGCSCINRIPCVPDTEPSPTQAPPCAPDAECIQTTQSLCVGDREYRSCCCTNTGGNGNCCDPPPPTLNGCTNQSFSCKTECGWNEIPQPSFDGDCITDPNYGDGYVCCQASIVSDCALDLDGVCKETCDTAYEFADDSVNNCWNPYQYPPPVPPPPGFTGHWECCILKSNQPPMPPPVYCKSYDPDDRTTNSASGRIATPIGCVPINDNQEFASFFLGWATGIAGGITLLLIIYGGFLIITSAGNSQKIQAGKELITAAVTGLVLLIFSLYILRLIGVQILNLPGFGR